MNDFLLRGRWLVGHLVVLAIAALFIRLGFWQIDRLHEVRTTNATIRAREHTTPVPLASVLPADGADVDSAVYRRVTATGTYDPSRQVAIRYRDLGDRTGAFIVTPLLEGDGSALLVNRGWIPMGDPNGPVPDEPPPTGQVTVMGTLLPSENGGEAPTRADGRLETIRIDPGAWNTAFPYRLDPVFLRMESSSPAEAVGGPRPVPAPPLSEGPHFSYAVQWFSFTAIGLVGWLMIIRRAVQERRPRTPYGPPETPAG